MASSEGPQDPTDKWGFKSNPFKILGISSDNPTPKDITAGYKSRIFGVHPDKAAGKEGVATMVNAAYNFLKNRDAEQLKKLAANFGGPGGGKMMGQDGMDLSNVLVDKTKSEHYRRLFEAYVKVAKETPRFNDNFRSFYKQVFLNVSSQPEVNPAYNCPLCEEDFIKAQHHEDEVYTAYIEYLREGAEPGYMEYLEKIFGTEVVNWVPPGQGTGNWRGESLASSFRRWCELFKPLKNDVQWMTKMESLGRRNGEDAMCIVTCLFSAMDHSEEDLFSSVLSSIPPTMEIGEIREIDLILPAFLHVIKDFKDWRKLSIKVVPASPRVALVLACVSTIISPNADDNFYQLGDAIVKSQKGFDYAHLSFMLGSCDLNFVASKILSLPNCHIEGKQLASYYLVRTNDIAQLEAIMKKSVENKDLEGAFVFANSLFNYHFIVKENEEKGLRTIASILPPNKYWKFIQAVAMDIPYLALNSTIVAEVAILRIVRKLENQEETVLEMFLGSVFGIQLGSTSTSVAALSGALHILHRDKERYELAVKMIKSGIRKQLDLKLVNADTKFILGLSRIPGVSDLLQEILEEKQYLAANQAKAQPGSTYHTCLLILRGIYHYKRRRFSEMAHDFSIAGMHTISEKIRNAIANFISSNPIIHEKVLKIASMQFQQLEAYIDDYTGESPNDSNFVEILQKASANEEPNLSASFSVSGGKGPDLVALEKDILGREDDDEEIYYEDEDNLIPQRRPRPGNPTSDDYVEKAYNYVNLEVICSGISETICCLTMAAQYFLKAMLSAPENDIPSKFGYRGLILECSKHLKDYVNIFLLPVPMVIHALRAQLSFVFRANQHFSEILRRNRMHNGSIPFIDEDEVPDQTEDWQLLLNLRTVCPIVTSDIFTIAEGKIALQFLHELFNSHLKEKISSGLYSENTPAFMFHHTLFSGVWGGRISPEDSGFEDEIPEVKGEKVEIKDDDSEEEKEKKRKFNEKFQREKEEFEEKVRQRERIPLVDRIGFKAARENAMCLLAQYYGYDLADVEGMMNWQIIRRNPEGFLDTKNRSLNFDGEQAFTRFVGIKMNPNTKVCELMLEPAVPGSRNRPALFSSVDLLEIFGNQICGAVLSFEDQLYPPNVPDYIKIMTPFHPFFKVMFRGITPSGANKESVCGTNLLMTLYHLDLLAKMLTTGQEIGANFPFAFLGTESNLLMGLSKELQSVLKPIGPRKKVKFLKALEYINRFWFELEEVEQEVIQGTQENGGTSTIKFGNASVVLKTMQMMRGEDGELRDAEHLFDQESPEANFVRGFNEKLHLIEKEFPIIQRIKELAKISLCFGLLYSNKENLEKNNPKFKELMEIRLPSTRPFSKCGGKDACKCCDWVPAVYHQMKVTDEQKWEHLFEKFSMGSPENALEWRQEKTKESFFSRLLNRVFDRSPDGQQKDTNASSSGNSNSAGQKKDEEKQSKPTNLGQYDRLEVYRCYGGVAFQPRSVQTNGIILPSGIMLKAWNAVMTNSNYCRFNPVARTTTTSTTASPKGNYTMRSTASAPSSFGGGGNNGNGNGGGGDGKKPPNFPKIYFPTERSNLMHIFKDEEGHCKENTRENRRTILVCAKYGKLEGVIEKWEKSVVTQILPDGRQVWAYVRGNKIVDAGINEVGKHRVFDPTIGLVKPKV